jgi:enterochelin esterase-like enzyme
MKGLARALLAFAASAAIAGSAFVADASEVISEHFQSEALGRDWAYNIYLPDGYEDGDMRFPVLYLLHGNGANQNEWVSKGLIQPTADRLIAAGEIPPALIVMPSAGTTWYVDRQDKMETAIIKDLIPEVQERYRVIDDRMGRVIGGESMGGYGALRFIMKYPEMFAAAALMSPAIYVPEPPATSSGRRVPPFQTDGKYDPEVWKSLNYPALMDAFVARNIVVPIYVDSGDHDDFQIDYQAPLIYKVWRDHNWPAEMRIVAGTHSFDVWRNTVPEALRFIFQDVTRPQLVEQNDQ